MSWSRAQVSSWRAGSDGRVVEQKTAGLYVEIPALAAVVQWFCSAVTAMFKSMAYAVDTLNQSGFDESSWLPMHSWTYSGGDYMIAVHGDRVVIAERAKLASLDELSQILRATEP